MIDKEIMEKVINKVNYIRTPGFIEVLPDGDILYGVKDQVTPYRAPKELLIFSHKFAKAFWGEENIRVNEIQEQQPKHYIRFDLIPAWQYHLQQMVLEEEPLNYLEKFL